MTDSNKDFLRNSSVKKQLVTNNKIPESVRSNNFRTQDQLDIVQSSSFGQRTTHITNIFQTTLTYER